MQYFSQILTAMLKVLDDPDPSIRELVLSLIVEMMKVNGLFLSIILYALGLKMLRV